MPEKAEGANTKVNDAADTITCEIHISAPPERVFEALVDPKQIVLWWGQPGIYRCTEFLSDLRPGGKFRNAGLDGHGRRFEICGEYLEVQPPNLLSHTWVATWTGEATTVVRWELEKTEHGTRLRIRHSGLAARPELAKSYQGWPRMLGWMRSFIEQGETVDRRPSIGGRDSG